MEVADLLRPREEDHDSEQRRSRQPGNDSDEEEEEGLPEWCTSGDATSKSRTTTVEDGDGPPEWFSSGSATTSKISLEEGASGHVVQSRLIG